MYEDMKRKASLRSHGCAISLTNRRAHTWVEDMLTSLKLTCPLKIGRNPKGKDCLPTIHFQGRAVSFGFLLVLGRVDDRINYRVQDFSHEEYMTLTCPILVDSQ